MFEFSDPILAAIFIGILSAAAVILFFQFLTEENSSHTSHSKTNLADQTQTSQAVSDIQSDTTSAQKSSTTSSQKSLKKSAKSSQKSTKKPSKKAASKSGKTL